MTYWFPGVTVSVCVLPYFQAPTSRQLRAQPLQVLPSLA